MFLFLLQSAELTWPFTEPTVCFEDGKGPPLYFNSTCVTCPAGCSEHAAYLAIPACPQGSFLQILWQIYPCKERNAEDTPCEQCQEFIKELALILSHSDEMKHSFAENYRLLHHENLMRKNLQADVTWSAERERRLQEELRRSRNTPHHLSVPLSRSQQKRQEDEIMELTTSLDQEKSKANSLQEKLDQMKREDLVGQKEIDELKESLHQANSDITLLEIELEQERLKNILTQEVSQVERLKEKGNNEKLAELRASSEQLELQITALREELDQEKLKTASKEKEIQNVRTQMKGIASQLAQAQTDLEQQKTKSNNEKKQFEGRLEKAQGKIDSLTKQLTQNQKPKETQSEKGKSNPEDKDLIESLRQQLDESKKKAEVMQSVITQLKKDGAPPKSFDTNQAVEQAKKMGQEVRQKFLAEINKSLEALDYKRAGEIYKGLCELMDESHPELQKVKSDILLTQIYSLLYLEKETQQTNVRVEELARRGSAHNPKDLKFYELLAESLVKQGLLEEARKTLEGAISKVPSGSPDEELARLYYLEFFVCHREYIPSHKKKIIKIKEEISNDSNILEKFSKNTGKLEYAIRALLNRDLSRIEGYQNEEGQCEKNAKKIGLDLIKASKVQIKSKDLLLQRVSQKFGNRFILELNKAEQDNPRLFQTFACEVIKWMQS